MNAPLWVPWVIVAILAVLSIILLMGKGSFLIAGYNMLSRDKKQRYHTKRLCRVVGGGIGVLDVIVAVAAFHHFEMPSSISWIIPWGLLGTVVVVEILVCTICRNKPPLTGK